MSQEEDRLQAVYWPPHEKNFNLAACPEGWQNNGSNNGVQQCQPLSSWSKNKKEYKIHACGTSHFTTGYDVQAWLKTCTSREKDLGLRWCTKDNNTCFAWERDSYGEPKQFVINQNVSPGSGSSNSGSNTGSGGVQYIEEIKQNPRMCMDNPINQGYQICVTHQQKQGKYVEK